MVEIMVSKRPGRVYDDYLKNSRYYFGIALPEQPLLLRQNLNIAYFGYGRISARKSWRWRLVFSLLWGLREHGGKHCKERRQPKVVTSSLCDRRLAWRYFAGFGSSDGSVYCVVFNHPRLYQETSNDDDFPYQSSSALRLFSMQ
ncbi:MAG: hypothetical protein GY821_13750 [Gammaproteobacteria bacterium]|nr:hypothetical protein [Gammaproteobacteria bacterium]